MDILECEEGILRWLGEQIEARLNELLLIDELERLRNARWVFVCRFNGLGSS